MHVLAVGSSGVSYRARLIQVIAAEITQQSSGASRIIHRTRLVRRRLAVLRLWLIHVVSRTAF